ncbi:hypothetical protein AMTR_s00039p00229740 [Amborella trichopoda]|uniref:Uncharacterized protein n=1 Tax=Amborella trichopoda TaxID=13333 RepID=U5D3D1_AMBTC|nr:hypothetical protein AMTR_s00039p00229740 [Amborella trichopoda]
MKNMNYPTCNNHTCNNGHKGCISEPCLSLEGHEISKESSKNWGGTHMAHCEEDWVPESVVAWKVFVKEKNPNVGGVPANDERRNEEGIL